MSISNKRPNSQKNRQATLQETAEWILMHRARPLEHQGLS